MPTANANKTCFLNVNVQMNVPFSLRNTFICTSKYGLIVVETTGTVVTCCCCCCHYSSYVACRWGSDHDHVTLSQFQHNVDKFKVQLSFPCAMWDLTSCIGHISLIRFACTCGRRMLRIWQLTAGLVLGSLTIGLRLHCHDDRSGVRLTRRDAETALGSACRHTELACRNTELIKS